MELGTGEMATITALLVLGGLLWIPVLGFTLRWALPPILDALARTREAGQRLSGVGRVPRGSATRQQGRDPKPSTRAPAPWQNDPMPTGEAR